MEGSCGARGSATTRTGRVLERARHERAEAGRARGERRGGEGEGGARGEEARAASEVRRVGDADQAQARGPEENVALKEKIEKAQAEEEERLRAATANQAARDALGDTRAASGSRWRRREDEQEETPANVDAAPRRGGDPPPRTPRRADGPGGLGSLAAAGAGAGGLRGANVVADSVALKDCVEALRGDPRGKILRAKAARMRE